MKLSEQIKNCLDGSGCKDCESYEPKSVLTCRGLLEKAYERINGYEELEEKNRLLKLPILVGDKVYRIWSCGKNGKSISEFVVTHIDIDNLPNIEFSYHKENNQCNYYFSKIEDIDKTVFLTREQAEAELKKNE